MTRKAVVSYAVDATDYEKMYELRAGIEACVYELLELGMDADDLRDHCESAVDDAADDLGNSEV